MYIPFPVTRIPPVWTGGTLVNITTPPMTGAVTGISTGGVDSDDENINLLDIYDFLNDEWITGSYGELYAALDDGSPAFEKIYDLGTAPGVVSCAVLNDVAVITEGVEKQPLWWAGCLDESGATDWTNPLAVWISQDGENWFDISTEVLDKDDDQYVILTNGVGAAGGLLIKSPVPQIKGFYFQFQTVNTEEGNETAGTTSLTINDSSDITQPDLKGDIVYWVQDSGATGHFEGETKLIDNAAAVDKGGGLVGIPMTSQPYSTGDSIELRLTDNYNGTYSVDATSSTNEIVITASYSAETFDGDETVNQRMTLGAGNDCPDVEQGIVVYYSGGNKIIVTISDDGEASGEVTLSGALTDQTITAIYGIYVDTNGARPGAVWDGVNTQTITLSGTFTGYGQSGYPIGTISIRNILNKSGQVTSSGDQVRFKLKSAPYIPFTSIGMNVQNVSIVERSGSTANGTTTPTEITVSATAKEALKLGDGEEWTEWTDFTFDHTKNQLGIIDLSYVTTVVDNPSKYHAIAGVASIMGGSYFKKNDASYNDQNVSGYETTFSDSNYYGTQFGMSAYEVRTRGTYPTTQFVGYTTFLDLADNYSVTGMTIDADEPSGSHIYVALSFDGLNTFQVYVDSAWQDIVQYSDPNWQYYDGSSWQNATVNTLLGALQQAFADSDNQMTIDELEALTVDELTDTAAFVSGATTTLSLAFAVISGGTEATMPIVRSASVSGIVYGSTTVLVHKDGAWESETWTDGTEVSQVPFAQDGIIETSEDYTTCDYHVVNGEPGYFVKLQFAEGLTAGTAITRIQMSAPCQPLANIGLGWDTTPLGFLFVDDSAEAVKDFTVEVSDYTETDDSTAWICDDITDPDTAVPMQTDDSILIGDVGLFNQVQLSIHKVYNNVTEAVLSAYYWNGEEWYPLTITDGTDVDGVTLAQKGTISFTVPSDWVQHSPYNEFVRGYWIKLMVSVAIDVVGITECRLQPVPNALAKHKYAAAWRNRVVMAARPDASDQVDISRELEEYGWSGGDIHSQRIGGQDNIAAVFSAFDRCFVAKPKDWFMLTESSEGFSFARLASITEAPVNNRCVVHAPAGSLGQGASPGLFFLGLNGAYLVTGIQSDLEWGTGQIQKISDSVNWWQSDPDVRLDLDYLYLSYGMYSSKHHCIFWAVPMITDGSTPQTTPNYLLVYDIGLGCWYPPWDLAFSALCSGFETNASAPGKLGQPVLYAGDAQGRVLKLFEATDDNGTEIDAYAETGLLTPLGVQTQAQLEGVFIVAKTGSADDELNMSIYLDGEATASIPILFDKAGDDTFTTYEAVNDFAGMQDGALGRFFKYRFDMSGPSRIYGIDIKHWDDLGDPDTG
jgi:hypothetical protein